MDKDVIRKSVRAVLWKLERQERKKQRVKQKHQRKTKFMWRDISDESHESAAANTGMSHIICDAISVI